MSDVKHQPSSPLPWDYWKFKFSGSDEIALFSCAQGKEAPLGSIRDEDDADFVVHAAENYQFLVRALKAELEQHEIWINTGTNIDYHRMRAGGIRALLNSIGEL